VVLKREPLGSLREEFLIPGRKFVPGRNWGGKAVNEKTKNIIFIYSTHIKIAQRGWFKWECLQCASTSCCFIIIIII